MGFFLLLFFLVGGRLLLFNNDKCTCEQSCRGVVVPSRIMAPKDILSLVQCVAIQGGSMQCDRNFCSECHAVVPSEPQQRFACADAKPLMSWMQLNMATQIRAYCSPPQPCQCHCSCPEIVWPVPPPMPLLP